MKIKIYPQVLYRIPKFPLNATLNESWEELKAAIALSSPEFYGLIKDVNSYELDGLPAATQYTIWKYFNRAKYRATPYASFAGVGLCPVTQQNEPSKLTISSEQHLHTYDDWPHKEDVQISATIVAEQNLKLFANSSYYIVKDVIRYISFIEGQFQLSEIEHYPTVITILQVCNQPITYKELINTLNEKGHPLDDPIEFLDQLIDLQLLITELHPNIVGQDYFQRIGFPTEQYADPYILAERQLISGALNESLFKDLDKLIPLLQQIVPIAEKPSLQQFANKFSQRFSAEEIPLLQALDPETGIGYDDLEQAGEEEELIVRLSHKAKTNHKENDQLKQLLLASQTLNVPIIRLDHLQADPAKIVIPLPNTFSALLTVTDELICVDSIGGCTANSLLGRFSLTNEAIAHTCRELAELEQDANPDMLFFDIAYIAENKVDNVSRRIDIYPLQLSILNYDTSAAPLTLEDINIFVQGSNLILWSKHYNKRLIPRLSSAYNHTRSDLSLFRLLCDLQPQGLQASLVLSLQAVLPDVTFYPRVQYKNFVLAPAKWKITYKDISTDIPAYLKQTGISRFFKAGLADQTLCFDQESAADMQAFEQYLRKQKTCSIEEAFIPQNSLIHDTNNRPYHSQLLVSLTHTEQVYPKGFRPQVAPDPDIQQIIPPGQDWLYFEIYCHSQRSDELLAGSVTQFLEEHQTQINKWFFIRYNENGDHIRFRVQIHNNDDGYSLITALTNLLHDDLQSGTVSDLQLKTYKRETARYGWATMPPIETHFCTDSHYVCSLIPAQLPAMEKYSLVIDMALAVKEAGLFDEKTFKYITDKFSNSFNTEHKLEVADFKELNTAYKQFKAQRAPELSVEQQQAFELFKQSFIENLAERPEEQRRMLFGDLIHMHVNRLFSANQRSHEMMMYYFLTKELQRVKATAANSVMA